MVTSEQYKTAVKQKTAFEKVIQTYHKEQRAKFDDRIKNGPVFTDDELVYSAFNLCPCGHGLAYPKDCGGDHYWDCSAILKGIKLWGVSHCPQLPFSMTKIKSENNIFQEGAKPTTRGVFKPRVEEE